MNPKQKLFHVSSVMGVVVLAVCFKVLGGGGGIVDNTPVDGMNTELPEASHAEIASKKTSAMERMQRQEQLEARKERLQSDSFDWWISSEEADVPTLQDQPVQVQQKVVSETEKKNENIHFNEIKSTKNPTSGQVCANNNRELAKAIVREKRRALEKRFGIQLPDEEEASEVVPVSPVMSANQAAENPVTVQKPKLSGFHDLDDAQESDDGEIKAVVHGDQMNLAAGAMVKMRLLEPVQTTYGVIPANSFLYGVLSFAENRAMIRTENIQTAGKVIPFKASIYDRDGFEGIYVPDNITSTVKNDAVGQSLSASDINVATPMGVVNTTARAVTQAVKSAAQSAVREPKISISSNYSILIKRQK